MLLIVEQMLDTITGSPAERIYPKLGYIEVGSLHFRLETPLTAYSLGLYRNMESLRLISRYKEGLSSIKIY